MDFGDVIFFIIFVIIIISNIMKQMKKAQKKSTGNQASQKEPAKKSGWKNVLEQMLEEARKQMEASGESEPAGTPLKHPTGWEDILPESRTEAPSYKEKSEKSKVYHTHLAKHQPIIHETPEPGRSQYRPVCMKCNEPMKKITDMGLEKQTGLIYCDHCGEQHKYRIVNGELNLKRAQAMRQSTIAPERRYRKIDESEEIPTITLREDSPTFAGKRFPRHLSREGLKNAVVWSEILGTPVGLKDMEL